MWVRAAAEMRGANSCNLFVSGSDELTDKQRASSSDASQKYTFQVHLAFLGSSQIYIVAGKN